MVSFGPGGLGWNGSAERIHAKKRSPFNQVENFLTEVSLNYAYRISKKVQLGGYYQSWHQEYKFKSKNGKSSSDLAATLYGIFVLYNFSEEINESYFLGFSTTLFNYEEENSGDFENAENKTPFEIDDSGMTYELTFGKRFALTKWNISHLTYAPQIGIFYRTHGKDFDDQDINEGVGLNIQAIKFDFLF